MSTINYYTIDREEELGFVPKNLYLLPVGSVSGIREEKKEQMELDGLICTRCGKKITKIPKSFSQGSRIGMCMDCALFVEKEQRKLREIDIRKGGDDVERICVLESVTMKIPGG